MSSFKRFIVIIQAVHHCQRRVRRLMRNARGLIAGAERAFFNFSDAERRVIEERRALR